MRRLAATVLAACLPGIAAAQKLELRGEAVVARAFDLASFEPGAYTARVTVTPTGGAPFTAAADFVVDP